MQYYLKVDHHQVVVGEVVGPVGESVEGGGEVGAVDEPPVAVVLDKLDLVVGKDVLHGVV